MQLSAKHSLNLHLIWPELKYKKRHLAAGLRPDPLWELTALPRHPTANGVDLRGWRGRERERRKGHGKGREGKGCRRGGEG